VGTVPGFIIDCGRFISSRSCTTSLERTKRIPIPHTRTFASLFTYGIRFARRACLVLCLTSPCLGTLGAIPPSHLSSHKYAFLYPTAFRPTPSPSLHSISSGLYITLFRPFPTHNPQAMDYMAHDYGLPSIELSLLLSMLLMCGNTLLALKLILLTLLACPADAGEVCT